MGVGQLSESDAVDALRLPFYRAIPQGHMVGGISLIWAIPNHLNKPEIFTFPMLSDDGLNSTSRKLEADMQAQSKRRVYPTGSHGWRNQFDLGNPESPQQAGDIHFPDAIG